MSPLSITVMVIIITILSLPVLYMITKVISKAWHSAYFEEINNIKIEKE